jgi:predicted Zn-dependent protease
VSPNTPNLKTAEELFQQGFERYKAGESAKDLIPVFQEITERQPKVASGWICLSWLYLLEDQAPLAVKAAQKAVKLSPEDPQGRINLAIALLETKQPGVREQVEAAENWLLLMSDLKAEIEANFGDGLRRRPDWPALTKVRSWLFETA